MHPAPATFGLCGLLVALICVLGRFTAAQDTLNIDELWQQATRLERIGQYDAAAWVYAQILEILPDSQRAAAKIAVCEYEAGRPEDAVASAMAAIQLNPHGRVWAETAYLFKARACSRVGCLEEAYDAIGILRDRFPDSISTARAEVLEAEMDGSDPTEARVAVARELEAAELHEAAQSEQSDHPDEAVALYDRVIAEFGDTRRSLRSREIKGLFLAGLPGRDQEAFDTFEDLLAVVVETAPHSRVRFEAQTRIGYLHLRSLRSAEALVAFDELAQIADDPAVRATAMLESAGAYFETLQRRREARGEVQAEEWEQLRQRCDDARSDPAASPEQRVRAELMHVESYWWELRPAPTLAMAEAFLAAYGESDWEREVATAKLAAGESLQNFGQHDEALDHYQWIVDRFGDREIWPGLTNLQRTYYRIYDALRRGGATWDQVDAAAEIVLTRYPDSQYAGLIRTAMSRERR